MARFRILDQTSHLEKRHVIHVHWTGNNNNNNSNNNNNNNDDDDDGLLKYTWGHKNYELQCAYISYN